MCAAHLRKYYNETTKIITMPEAEDYKPCPFGIGYLLFISMKKNSDKIVQIETTTGEEDTYEALLERCVRTAIELTNRGITKDDVICLCSENNLNSAVPFIASMFLGVKVCSLDPTSSPQDCIHFLKKVKPNMLIVSSNSLKLIKKALEDCEQQPPIIINGKSNKYPTIEEFLTPKPNEKDFEPRKVTDISEAALIVSTSGTSGLPKAILLSHQFLMFHCKPIKAAKLMAYSSLFWTSMIFGTLISILSGTIKMVAFKFDPKQAWELIEKYKINLLFLTSYETIAFIRNRPAEVLENCSLQVLQIGGSFIPEEYLIKTRNVLPNTIVLHLYGQTEIPYIFKMDIPIMLKKIGCMGIPGNSRIYKIVDPETEENLGFNQTGELRVKTKFCMSGFYNQDDSSAFDKDGFLKTGDVAYFDEEFCFYIVDRVKEMFKYKTYHIVPAKVESILLSHQDVEFGAVVGLPHKDDGNHVMAVVQLVNGAKSTAADIETFVNERVEDDTYILRGGCKITQNMPFAPSGKIKRRVLRDMFTKHLE